jgi:hypothetical protein
LELEKGKLAERRGHKADGLRVVSVSTYGGRVAKSSKKFSRLPAGFGISKIQRHKNHSMEHLRLPTSFIEALPGTV